MLDDLDAAVRQHTGEFLCERIHDRRTTKLVKFEHVVTGPLDADDVPDIGRLRELYSTFGSVLFYHDPRSGDAGKHLAPVAAWSELRDLFWGWIENLEEDEREEIVPDWVESAIVIGEAPHSGNYILVPVEGPWSGHVFEFEHDGFEFTAEAENVIEYVEKLLRPDASRLLGIASNMRFVEGDERVQWWIRELRHSDGHVVRLEP